MDSAPLRGAQDAPERFRWVFAYTVHGDLRYISHHDTLRLFQRALVRADIPLRWSEGFNPHPRMTIPLPRPVGIASDAECIVVDTTCAIDAQDARRRLSATLPDDMRITDVRRLGQGETLQPAAVRYRLDVNGADRQRLEEQLRALRDAATIPVLRHRADGRQHTTIDLRPYLAEIGFDGGHVQFTLRVTGEGTARPSEIAALLGYEATSINHRMTRLEIQWH
ncbi:MAG: DUF2344 domain-containing protein [Planctomycetes bacterium]|nr:DUF2344 domain-containing protein [Planctomycetota bacterium]